MEEVNKETTTEVVSQKIRKGKKLPKSVRPEEWVALIKVTPTTDYLARVGFLLAYGAGMRISEVLRCSREHFRETSIFIPESKYGVERIVPIPKGWRAEFNKHIPLKTTRRTLDRKFNKYAEKAKLNPLYTFHSLRHGFATRLVESGVPINQVQVLMGHSNLATTSIYTRASPMDAIKNYEELF